MSFESKKIIDSNVNTHSLGRGVVAKHIFMAAGVLFGGFFLAFAGIKGRTYLSSTLSLSQGTGDATTLSPGTTTSTKTINALIVGIGGKGHRGAYNTDTIIVVSYNPRTRHLNMISLPRDLYVHIDKSYYSRINSILDYYITQKNYSLDESLAILRDKVGELIGQDIAYHALVDFQGFEQIIDTLGGIEVDVPKELYDPSFPIDDFNYGTLTINSGRQTMDGSTALNYARSRHSTSDFDRSARQQIIIRSLLKKLISFSSLSKIKTLYNDFISSVNTNVGINTILQYIPYITKVDYINTIVFQADCPESINQMQHGCVLYSPPREFFGGAAILLPLGATTTTLSDYTQLFSFVHRSLSYPFGFFKGFSLAMYNSIDTDTLPRAKPGFVSKLGIELIRNGLDVTQVGNNTLKQDKNMIFFISGSTSDQKIRASYTMLIEDILNIGVISLGDEKDLPQYYTGSIHSGTNVIMIVGGSSVLSTMGQ